MSGTAPVVALTLDGTAPYPPGTLITATASISDADNTTETLRSVDHLGRTDLITIVRTDPATVTWSWASTGKTIARGLNPLKVAAPTGSDVLIASVVDGQGNVTTTKIAVTITMPTLIGFDVSPLTGESVAQAFTRVGKLLPGARYVRVYNGPGKGLTQSAWGTGAMSALPAGATAHVSFKDTPNTALLKPWFDAIPSSVARVYLTVHHEPEGDLPIAQYQTDWAALRAFRDAHANKRKVVLVEILTMYAEEHGKGPTTAWWSGHADAVAWDCYRDGTTDPNDYPAPATFFGPLIAVAKQLGVPWLVPEFGSKLIAGDTGAGRAGWMTACVAYLRATGCVAVGWWDTGGEDLASDPAGLTAWRAALSTQ